jgi:hypothetical protein
VQNFLGTFFEMNTYLANEPIGVRARVNDLYWADYCSRQDSGGDIAGCSYHSVCSCISREISAGAKTSGVASVQSGGVKGCWCRRLMVVK